MYLDKQVGAVIAELEKLGLRERALVIFTADNGTALNFPSEIGGRMINGKKGSIQEGSSRVPFIANWPGKTPAELNPATGKTDQGDGGAKKAKAKAKAKTAT